MGFARVYDKIVILFSEDTYISYPNFNYYERTSTLFILVGHDTKNTKQFLRNEDQTSLLFLVNQYIRKKEFVGQNPGKAIKLNF